MVFDDFQLFLLVLLLLLFQNWQHYFDNRKFSKLTIAIVQINDDVIDE